ncbi:Na+/H+ antiporter [Phenylobacterium sp.]|uniref:Na+/H+ antiporter n=1 Tax=Phenylobacterium sp. TaxID=1871053 RepID=UPI0035B37C29
MAPLDPVITSLFFLLAVVISGILARVTRLPLPLVQIGLGAAIALLEIQAVELRPELFFLLFLPPLLFLDGWRIPKGDLLRDRAAVLALAIGLVVLTVLGLGWFIHWMIPAVPLAVAFALAAIISPTDPIAVSAISARAPIPKRMMHILEGEALLNDASGLVCMRLAVAAMLTGGFSVQQAVLSFLWLALGGVAVGVGVTLGVSRAKQWVSDRLGEDTGAQVLVSLLMPFAAYLAAERLHCSAILAAVAAGVTMSFTEQTGLALAATRVRRTAVWDTVQFTANGVIFVLLGEQMPALLSKAAKTVKTTGHAEAWWLAIYVLAIVAALGAMRFAWVWMSFRWTLFRARRRDAVSQTADWRLIAAMTLAGVRGAITLAGVLTLPLHLHDGTAFPARNLAIFLAGGVILVSLVVASVGLPRVLEGLKIPPEPSRQVEIDEARVAAAQAAIQAIEGAQHALAEGRADADLYAGAAARVMQLYRQRIDARARGPEALALDQQIDQIERKLRLAGLAAERAEIFRRARARELEDEEARRLVREIDLLEARYS